MIVVTIAETDSFDLFPDILVNCRVSRVILLRIARQLCQYFLGKVAVYKDIGEKCNQSISVQNLMSGERVRCLHFYAHKICTKVALNHKIGIFPTLYRYFLQAY